MNVLEGKLTGTEDIKIGIVAARFNEFIVSRLIGGASHYDYVCNEVSKGIASVSLQSKIPVMFGVLTTDNIEQAIERAGSKAGNKGYECAVGAIEMVNLMRVMEK